MTQLARATRLGEDDPTYAEAVLCPTCESESPDGVRFCGTCGHELERRADERRVVTVLFADIVGFTGFSESRDPEQVKNLVDRCFVLLADDITSFGGRVDKVIGDAIVALFGAPIAHEDDAERAVRAALRMQDTVGGFDADTGVGIRLRIGINTGEVLVGAISAGDDYTAMGDVVNTASRLQTTAEPGAVVVGSVTQEATAEVIRYRSLGQMHVRGRELPVSTFRVLGPYGRPGERRRRAETPLVGRDPELALLKATVVSGFGSRRAQLIALAGESGVGKSKLAGEIAEWTRFEQDAVLLHGRCLPYGEANIWWPVAETISGAIGLDADADGDQARVAIVRAVDLALAEHADELDLARVTEGLVHLLGAESAVTNLDADRATAEATRAIRILLTKLASRGPVIWWLSDLHFADQVVIELVDSVLDRLARLPIVVLATGTQSLFDRWKPQPGRFNVLSLTLEPLSDTSMLQLAQNLAPDLSAETTQAIVDRSGGNPLFLEEMARMVHGSAGNGSDALPTTVTGAIGARLDALSDLARGVIGDAAVLGVRSDNEALITMGTYTQNGSDVVAAMDELARADLLDVGPEAWEFRSNVIREVAYYRQTKSDRAFKHAGVAGWLADNERPVAPGSIAWHYRQAAALAADLGGIDGMAEDLDEMAIRWTLQAADGSFATSSFDHVDGLHRELLERMANDDPRRSHVLLDRARLALRAMRFDAVAGFLGEAERATSGDDPTQPLQVLLIRSELDQWSDDLDGALRHASVAFELAEQSGETQSIAAALRRRGLVELFQGEHVAAAASIHASLVAYERLGDSNGMAWARQNLAWIAFIQGRMGEAEERLIAAGEAFAITGDRSGQAWSSGLLAYVRIHDGRFAEADALAAETLEDTREQGDRWGQGMMSVALASSALWTGRVDDALSYAESALSSFPAGSDAVGLGQAFAARGRALVRRGRVSQGFRVLEGAASEMPTGLPHEMMHTAIAAAAATVGDVERVARYLGELSDFDPDVIGDSERVVAASLMRLQQGDPTAARALLAELPPPDADTGSTWAWAVLALTLVANGDDPADHVDLVETAGRSTYADRVLARLATAAAAARANDALGVRAAISRAREAIPNAGDEVFPAIVGLAEAIFLQAVDDLDGSAIAASADRRLDELELQSTGWRAAFASLVAL